MPYEHMRAYVHMLHVCVCACVCSCVRVCYLQLPGCYLEGQLYE